MQIPRRQMQKTNLQRGNETHLVDMSKLTVEDLLEEMNKRVQSSKDTSLKRQLAMIVERRSLPAKTKRLYSKSKNKWPGFVSENRRIQRWHTWRNFY